MRRFARLVVAVLSLGVADDRDEDADPTQRFFTGVVLIFVLPTALMSSLSGADHPCPRHSNDLPETLRTVAQNVQPSVKFDQGVRRAQTNHLHTR